MDVTRICSNVRNVRDADTKDCLLNSSFKKKSCKRKRRPSGEYESYYENEAKRRFVSSSSSEPILPSCSSDRSSPLSSPMARTVSDIDGKSPESECPSTFAEYDVCGYGSSGSPIEASSPLSCHSNTTKSGTSWHTRGDVTPHGKRNYRRILNYVETIPQCCITSTAETRPCPLPALSWANALDVWKVMCQKDELGSIHRSSSMLESHPGLQPRMRAILLDWLIEVCEVYKLHRETYYLAVDYLDRYLTSSKKIQKTHLQLIGITCLFVAAKVEEIYPPKIGEFAYVTDGACQEEDILQQELLLLKTLDWSISPVTILGWLGVYMQLNVSNRTPSSFVNRNGNSKSSKSIHIDDDSKCENGNSNQQDSSVKERSGRKRKQEFSDSDMKKLKFVSSMDDSNSRTIRKPDEVDDAFIYPQFSGLEFVQTAQLIDLCSLDLGIADYSYSVIAAAAISHTFTRETAIRLSGLDWNTISSCAQWMEPFFDITRDESQHLFLIEQNEQVKSKFGLGHVCPNIVTDDSHIIQTHTTSIKMFDKALLRRDYYQTQSVHNEQETSPAIPSVCPEGLLTPPASSRKPADVGSEPDTHI